MEKEGQLFVIFIKYTRRHVIFWGGQFKNTSHLTLFRCSIVVIQCQTLSYEIHVNI